jgi:WD repeat-containing protein 35
VLIKKIYVLAAFEVESFKRRRFDSQMPGGGVSVQQTLDTLITTDINTSTEKALTNPWKGAEAIHFYLLCQRQLYQKYQIFIKFSFCSRNYSAALRTE